MTTYKVTIVEKRVFEVKIDSQTNDTKLDIETEALDEFYNHEPVHTEHYIDDIIQLT